MTEFDWKFNALLYDIVRKGEKRKTRNYDTKSLFAQTLSFDLINFPILTIKEVHFRTLATELLWFLKGDTNIKYLWIITATFGMVMPTSIMRRAGEMPTSGVAATAMVVLKKKNVTGAAT